MVKMKDIVGYAVLGGLGIGVIYFLSKPEVAEALKKFVPPTTPPTAQSTEQLTDEARAAGCPEGTFFTGYKTPEGSSICCETGTQYDPPIGQCVPISPASVSVPYDSPVVQGYKINDNYAILPTTDTYTGDVMYMNTPTEVFTPEKPRVILYCRVRDASTGLPLNGATVKVTTVGGTSLPTKEALSTTTNATGLAQFVIYKDITYTVIAIMSGYNSKSRTVTLTASHTYGFDLPKI